MAQIFTLLPAGIIFKSSLLLAVQLISAMSTSPVCARLLISFVATAVLPIRLSAGPTSQSQWPAIRSPAQARSLQSSFLSCIFPPFAVIVFIIQYSHTVDNERIYETVCNFPISCSYSCCVCSFLIFFSSPFTSGNSFT